MTPTDAFQNIAIILYCALVPAHAVALRLKRNLSRHLTIVMGLAILANLMAIVFRGVEVQHWPFQTMYEALLLVSLCVGIGYLLIYFSNGLYVQDRFTALVANPLGLIVSAVAAFFIILAASSDAYKADLPPALQSIWFAPHVAVYLFGYGALIVAFCAAVIYLILAKKLGAARSAEAETQLDFLDNFVYRCIAVGFPFLTMGLIFGALWAQVAWATYWGWDSKEVWSLITWLVYIVYLHLRYIKGWRGTRSAWFVVLGAIAILITFQLFGFLPASQASVHKYAG
jgi:cytochrome c-type biogenesis protein CcsB